MLSLVKMLLKGEVGSYALNSHGNYIVDHGKAWKNHGFVILNSCKNPVNYLSHWIVAKAQTSMRIYAVSPEPFFAHIPKVWM